ncbi:MAG: hypothetical protein ACE5OZ_19685 [Candidatus Heimdallarchaeota archaeon]
MHYEALFPIEMQLDRLSSLMGILIYIVDYWHKTQIIFTCIATYPSFCELKSERGRLRCQRLIIVILVEFPQQITALSVETIVVGTRGPLLDTVLLVGLQKEIPALNVENIVTGMRDIRPDIVLPVVPPKEATVSSAAENYNLQSNRSFHYRHLFQCLSTQ